MSNIKIKFTNGRTEKYYGTANAIGDVFFIITDDLDEITIPKVNVQYIIEY